MTARKAPSKSIVASAAAVPEAASLPAELRQLIERSRQAEAVAVNAELTPMYWRIGARVLVGQCATYGGEIVATLSRQLADYLTACVGPFTTAYLPGIFDTMRRMARVLLEYRGR